MVPRGTDGLRNDERQVVSRFNPGIAINPDGSGYVIRLMYVRANTASYQETAMLHPTVIYKTGETKQYKINKTSIKI